METMWDKYEEILMPLNINNNHNKPLNKSSSTGRRSARGHGLSWGHWCCQSSLDFTMVGCSNEHVAALLVVNLHSKIMQTLQLGCSWSPEDESFVWPSEAHSRSTEVVPSWFWTLAVAPYLFSSRLHTQRILLSNRQILHSPEDEPWCNWGFDEPISIDVFEQGDAGRTHEEKQMDDSKSFHKALATGIFPLTGWNHEEKTAQRTIISDMIQSLNIHGLQLMITVFLYTFRFWQKSSNVHGVSRCNVSSRGASLIQMVVI